MKKRAVIFDLDNTIYPVASIGDQLFEPLFKLIEDAEVHQDDMEEIRKEVMKKPYQVVADQYKFSEELKDAGQKLLADLEYDGPIEPFDDYSFTTTLQVDRFLVTTGFKKLQQSKVRKMNLEHDFKKVYIVDPAETEETKKDIFEKIISENKYQKEEVLVIGDDPGSEIQAAKDLSLDSILYDKNGDTEAEGVIGTISNFRELEKFLK